MGERLDRTATRHRVVWSVLALTVGGWLGFAGFISLALGSCHGGGGFCSGELDRDAVLEGYVAGVAFSGSAAGFIPLVFTRRLGIVAAAVSGVIVVGTAFVLWLEFGGAWRG